MPPWPATLLFIRRTLAAFRANQGFLLASAIAYNTLLSILPLLILLLIALSHVVDTSLLVATLGRSLELLVPGQSHVVMDEVNTFLANRAVIGTVLFVTLIFFSSLAFTVLENAMAVIFHHRARTGRRHFLVSALIPYICITVLGIGAVIVTLVAGLLDAIGAQKVELLGHAWSLGGVSGVLLYVLGVAGEVLVLTSIYLVMPVGRLSVRYALVGGATATVLWEITRHILVWYLSTLSQVRIVYGSLATVIVVLLSLEIGALILLLGAQVIAELERVHHHRRTRAAMASANKLA